MKFITREEIKKIVGANYIKNQYDKIWFKKNDKTRMKAICVPKYPLFINCFKMQNEPTFQIKNMNLEHKYIKGYSNHFATNT